MNLKDVRDAYRVRRGYWFAPKLFGWGATPVTWQGWLATLVALAGIAGFGRLAQLRGPIFLVPAGAVLIGFVVLCWAKTDGGWHWRWGPGDRDRDR